jgi:phage-related protein
MPMATNKNTDQKNGGHAGMKAAAVIGGLAAATAAGMYFLHHNKGAQKKLKHIRGWVIKAKGEILEKVERLKEVNEELYNKAVDAVMAKYKKISSIDGAELSAVTTELKSHWRNISRELKGSAKAVASGARSVKNAVRTVVKTKPAAKRASKPKAASTPKAE